MAKVNLRKEAKGRECQVRLFGVCNGNAETVVLRQAMQKLQRDVNKQAAKSIRKIAKSAIKKATKEVAQQIGVNAKTVRGRARLTFSPTASNPKAVIRVNRSHMPLIRVLETKRNRISARKGVLRVGQHSVARGFVQRLANGRTHIMFRQGRERYGIDVAKIPLATPLPYCKRV